MTLKNVEMDKNLICKVFWCYETCSSTLQYFDYAQTLYKPTLYEMVCDIIAMKMLHAYSVYMYVAYAMTTCRLEPKLDCSCGHVYQYYGYP